MGYDVPETEPTEFTAGDSWQWNKTLSDYPPSEGWELTYLFRGAEDYNAAWGDDVSADSDNDSFEVRIPKADTNLAAGTYRLVGYVDDGDDRHIVHDEHVTVWPNPTDAVGAGTHAEQMVTLLEARLKERHAEDVSEWTRGERQQRKEELRQLEASLNRWRQEVYAERNPEHPFQSVEAHFHAP